MGKSGSLRDDWAGPCLLTEEMRTMVKLRYDVRSFDFAKAAHAALGNPLQPSPPLRRALVQARQLSANQCTESTWRQARTWKQSEEWTTFQRLYERFVEEWIMPQFGGSDLLVQAEPVLRCVLPGSVSPCKPHCDADYYHDPSEVNYWVPLTHVSGANSLWVETSPGASDFQPIEACFGQAVRFYGNRCNHFTVPNTSGRTRISFDFRVLPASLAAATPRTIVTNRKLEAGGYYRLLRCGEKFRPDLELLAERPTHKADEHVPRTCKHCGEPRQRGDFADRQWRKPRPTCIACQKRIEQCQQVSAGEGGGAHRHRRRDAAEDMMHSCSTSHTPGVSNP